MNMNIIDNYFPGDVSQKFSISDQSIEEIFQKQPVIKENQQNIKRAKMIALVALAVLVVLGAAFTGLLLGVGGVAAWVGMMVGLNVGIPSLVLLFLESVKWSFQSNSPAAIKDSLRKGNKEMRNITEDTDIGGKIIAYNRAIEHYEQANWRIQEACEENRKTSPLAVEFQFLGERIKEIQTEVDQLREQLTQQRLRQ